MNKKIIITSSVLVILILGYFLVAQLAPNVPAPMATAEIKKVATQGTNDEGKVPEEKGTEEVLPETEVVASPPIEVSVHTIALAGIIDAPSAEISAMDWAGDWLILVPQYPGRFGDVLFAIHRDELLDAIGSENAEPIEPKTILFNAPGIRGIEGYEGIEAIAFDGEDVYITVEGRDGRRMAGYLMKGIYDGEMVSIDVGKAISIPAATSISNYSEEAIFLTTGGVVTMYEVNGENINSAPMVHGFDRELTSTKQGSFPNIEYRVTDATRIDGEGKFWMINYNFPGSQDDLKVGADYYVDQFGEGETHKGSDIIERLIELQYLNGNVMFTDTPPIQFMLLDNGDARNWEGIVRLDDIGFLIVTDKFPETILGFVRYP